MDKLWLEICYSWRKCHQQSILDKATWYCFVLQNYLLQLLQRTRCCLPQEINQSGSDSVWWVNRSSQPKRNIRVKLRVPWVVRWGPRWSMFACLHRAALSSQFLFRPVWWHSPRFLQMKQQERWPPPPPPLNSHTAIKRDTGHKVEQCRKTMPTQNSRLCECWSKTLEAENSINSQEMRTLNTQAKITYDVRQGNDHEENAEQLCIFYILSAFGDTNGDAKWMNKMSGKRRCAVSSLHLLEWLESDWAQIEAHISVLHFSELPGFFSNRTSLSCPPQVWRWIHLCFSFFVLKWCNVQNWMESRPYDQFKGPTWCCECHPRPMVRFTPHTHLLQNRISSAVPHKQLSVSLPWLTEGTHCIFPDLQCEIPTSLVAKPLKNTAKLVSKYKQDSPLLCPARELVLQVHSNTKTKFLPPATDSVFKTDKMSLIR